MLKFKTREEAGRQLAEQMARFRGEVSVVMAVLNGGLPVAQPVARVLNTSLQPVPMRSLQIHLNEETIIGYVSHKGDLQLNQPLIGQVRLTPAEIRRMAQKSQRSLCADLESWGIVVPEDLQQKNVLIVDDGMHSGWTMFSAVETIKQMGVGKIFVAVPVTHFRAKRFLSRHCEEVVTLATEDIALYQIRNYYEDYPDITNQQAGDLLKNQPAPQQSAA